jgi:hypothetical protein
MGIILLLVLIGVIAFIWWLVSEFIELVSLNREQVEQNKEIIELLKEN